MLFTTGDNTVPRSNVVQKPRAKMDKMGMTKTNKYRPPRAFYKKHRPERPRSTARLLYSIENTPHMNGSMQPHSIVSMRSCSRRCGRPGRHPTLVGPVFLFNATTVHLEGCLYSTRTNRDRVQDAFSPAASFLNRTSETSLAKTQPLK